MNEVVIAKEKFLLKENIACVHVVCVCVCVFSLFCFVFVIL